MSLEIFKKSDQASGQFNNGQILENKPIGFPQDRGIFKPFSNILYWAHAWTPGAESLIGEHPHQGFEILSFVIEGSLSHYDSKLNEWQELDKGAVQIIRAGSGITHAERVREHSSFFQIWFDPNLIKSLKEDASYNNYPGNVFRTLDLDGYSRKDYVGNTAPIIMSSKGVEIYEIMLENGSISLPLREDKTRSLYVLHGDLDVNGSSLMEHDFIHMSDENNMHLSNNKRAKCFVIDLLKDPRYPTYIKYKK